MTPMSPTIFNSKKTLKFVQTLFKQHGNFAEYESEMIQVFKENAAAEVFRRLPKPIFWDIRCSE